MSQPTVAEVIAYLQQVPDQTAKVYATEEDVQKPGEYVNMQFVIEQLTNEEDDDDVPWQLEDAANHVRGETEDRAILKHVWENLTGFAGAEHSGSVVHWTRAWERAESPFGQRSAIAGLLSDVCMTKPAWKIWWHTPPTNR
jgi:type IV secretory pathway TrbF-like protein